MYTLSVSSRVRPVRNRTHMHARAGTGNGTGPPISRRSGSFLAHALDGRADVARPTTLKRKVATPVQTALLKGVATRGPPPRGRG